MPSGASGPAGLLFDAVLESDFLFWAASRLAQRALMPLLLGTPPQVVAHADRGERARVAQVRDHLMPLSLRRMGVMNDASFTPSLPRYDLERISVPTLVIGTADDVYGTYDGARYSAKHIRGATFVGYETGGHLLVGHLQDALTEIRAFLSQCESRTAVAGEPSW